MESKKWYESKTVWAGVLMVVIGVAQVATSGQLDPGAISNALIGLGFVGARQAID